MDTIYNDIGINYSVTRRTDPNIAEQLYSELQGATRIVNIGAGTRSYAPENIALAAVEPSSKMISQRKPGSHGVEQVFAEKLPFENDLASGVWAKNNHPILNLSSLDVGYRIISAKVRNI